MKATVELNKIKGMARIEFASHAFFWEEFAPKDATHVSFGINGKTNILWWDENNKISKWDDYEEWEKFSGVVSKKAIRRPIKIRGAS